MCTTIKASSQTRLQWRVLQFMTHQGRTRFHVYKNTEDSQDFWTNAPWIVSGTIARPVMSAEGQTSVMEAAPHQGLYDFQSRRERILMSHVWPWVHSPCSNTGSRDKSQSTTDRRLYISVAGEQEMCSVLIEKEMLHYRSTQGRVLITRLNK